MKIIIVSEQPISNICGMEEFQRKLTEDNDTEVCCLRYTAEKADAIFSEIKSQNPDLLITIDLSGFEQCTLTDSVAYNLLNCKQFHLLMSEDLPNELYLGRPLNIAMFFCCVGGAYYDRLMRKYPDLPYLKALEDWQSGGERPARTQNAQILYEAYKEVLAEIMCGGGASANKSGSLCSKV